MSEWNTASLRTHPWGISIRARQSSTSSDIFFEFPTSKETTNKSAPGSTLERENANMALVYKEDEYQSPMFLGTEKDEGAVNLLATHISRSLEVSWFPKEISTKVLKYLLMNYVGNLVKSL